MIEEMKRHLLTRGIQQGFFFSKELISKPISQFTVWKKDLVAEGPNRVIDADLVEIIGDLRPL